MQLRQVFKKAFETMIEQQLQAWNFAKLSTSRRDLISWISVTGAAANPVPPEVGSSPPKGPGEPHVPVMLCGRMKWKPLDVCFDLLESGQQ